MLCAHHLAHWAGVVMLPGHLLSDMACNGEFHMSLSIKAADLAPWQPDQHCCTLLTAEISKGCSTFWHAF